jgi:RNA polymerase sigma-70 factor (ECF subfamily)
VEQTDEALVAALRHGDERALSTLIERYAPSVYRFGVKICGNPEDAKDVVQETLLAAARGLRDFRGASSLSTWLYKVARTFCIKKRRRSRHAPTETVSLDHPSQSVDIASSDVPADEALVRNELGSALDAAIASLDPIHREVLVLRDVEGLTALEVSEVLGVSVEAVKSRLHRARAEVRNKLAPVLQRELPPVPPPSGACPDVAVLFSQYLEGEIGPAECQAMQQHVETCASCNTACESLRRTVALCRPTSQGKLPKEVQVRLRRALEAVVHGRAIGAAN